MLTFVDYLKVFFIAIIAYIFDFFYTEIEFKYLIILILLFFVFNLLIKKNLVVSLGVIIFVFFTIDSGPRIEYDIIAPSNFYGLNYNLLFAPIIYFFALFCGISLINIRFQILNNYITQIFLSFFVILIINGFISDSLNIFRNSYIYNPIGIDNYRYLLNYSLCIIGSAFGYKISRISELTDDRVTKWLVICASGKIISGIFLFLSGRFEIWGLNVITNRPSYGLILFVFIYALLSLNRNQFKTFSFFILLTVVEFVRYTRRGIFLEFCFVIFIWSFLFYRSMDKFSYRELKPVISILFIFAIIYLFISFASPDDENSGLYSSIGDLLTFVSGDNDDLRVVELKNIIYSQTNNFYQLLIGAGFSGLVSFDYFNYLRPLTSSDYNAEMLNSGVYFPHSWLNIVLLKSGFIGLFFYVLTFFLIIKNVLKVIFNRSLISKSINSMSVLTLPVLVYQLFWGVLVSDSSAFLGSLILGFLFGCLNKYSNSTFLKY